MRPKQIIEKQGWDIKKEGNFSVCQFEDDVDTIKIYVAEDNIDEEELATEKNKLWNVYYSRILLYKDPSDKYKVWTNNQAPDVMGDNFNSDDFNEKLPPTEYWSRFVSKTSKNSVDLKLEEGIVDVFRKLSNEYDNKDDLISIILTSTFVRFLEDRELSSLDLKLVQALEAKADTDNLFKKYNTLHNGEVFKNNALYGMNDKVRGILTKFLKNNLFSQQSLFHFNFKYIPIELISNIYEKLITEKLGEDEKRKRGITYTPPKLAHYLTKEAFRQLDKKLHPREFLKIKIGDLSTGSGIFLVLAFRELLKRIEKSDEKVSFEHKKRALKELFYGVDLDDSAINITKFSLYIELLENESKILKSDNKFPILNNIETRNALLYDKHDSFFDLVIGNPPWGARKFDYFEMIKDKEYSDRISQKEIAQIFVNIGIEKLKDGGVLALVLPSSSFYQSSGTSYKFRNSLLKDLIVKEFVDFSPIRQKIFKNSVPACVIVCEKTKEAPLSYNIPMRRVVNKADYLYFNRISGVTNNIDSNFLKSRPDSWNIAIKGGNITGFFMNRMTRYYSYLGEAVDKITTGYQGTKGKTICEEKTDTCSTPLIYDPGIKLYCAESKRATRRHYLLDKSFIKEKCLIIHKKYKYDRTPRLHIMLKPNGYAFSEYFVGINPESDSLLYFVSCLLSSRFSMFFVNMIGPTVPLLSSEQKDSQIQKRDIERIPFPDNFEQFIDVIEIGRKLVNKEFKNLDELKHDVDKEIEKVFELNHLEKKLIEQWEKVTKREPRYTNKKLFSSYQKGFEQVLDNLDLSKPKKWGEPKLINGVDIITFSNDAELPRIGKEIQTMVNKVVTGKKEVDFKFITGNKGVIVRKEENNNGFITGFLDAELVLSEL